ncbi:MAG: MAPEG family protein [Verrucomicrobiota bacterium]
MTIELHMLALSVILGIVHLVAASHFISFQYGYRWTASNREEKMPPLKGAAGRVDRAATNFLETFPLFAAAVLIAHVAGRHSALTVWGVHLYFWGRVVYAVAYSAGFSYVRSFIWNVATGGIILLLIALW